MRRRRTPFVGSGGRHSVAVGSRDFGITDDGPSTRRTGPECDQCHRPIMFVRDDDDWRHLDALVDDDAHAAQPQIQP